MISNKYYKIYLALKEKILNHDYKEDELLPSENNLAQEYSVSRETIRKALEKLSKDGLIQKQQGKGSIVLNQKIFNFPISGLTSFKELADDQGMHAKTILLSNKQSKIDGPLKKKLKIGDWNQVLKIERIREIDKQKVILDYDYLNPDIVGEIPDHRLEDSLYDYLEKDLQLAISFASKEIVIENINENDQKYLDLRDEDRHLVVIRSYVYLEDTRLFQFSESRHRLDKFRFMDFSRRKHRLDLPTR
ncbi:MAG: trehalose operon repressor [Atopostipes suicloacalis]|nr:trehalose operon repressor [Atopostipes suicloacalis]